MCSYIEGFNLDLIASFDHKYELIVTHGVGVYGRGPCTNGRAITKWKKNVK